ncbi:hypothetical protein C8R46DRAFT_911381, partial [Mycena filopes]
MIASDHKALLAVKTAARSGLNGRLIRWDEYLSRFDFEIFHVEGVQNKVADCLSRYYENDTPEDHYEADDFVNADARLDPDLEFMTRLREEELRASQISLLARRVTEPVEARVTEAEELEKYAERMENRGFDTTAISLEESLNSQEPLRPRVEGDKAFLEAVKARYHKDSVLSKVTQSPADFAQFAIQDGLIYARNVEGKLCLALPRGVRLHGKQTLTGIAIDQAH